MLAYTKNFTSKSPVTALTFHVIELIVYACIILYSSTVFRDHTGLRFLVPPLNQLDIHFVTPWQYWSCIA